MLFLILGFLSDDVVDDVLDQIELLLVSSVAGSQYSLLVEFLVLPIVIGRVPMCHLCHRI